MQARSGSIIVKRAAQATCTTKVSRVNSSVLGARGGGGRLVACFQFLLDMAEPAHQVFR